MIKTALLIFPLLPVLPAGADEGSPGLRSELRASIKQAGVAAQQANSSPSGSQAPAGQVWQIVDDRNQPLNPVSVAEGGGDLFFLDPATLWKVPAGKSLLSLPETLRAVRAGPSASSIAGVPIQEFTGLTFCPDRQSVVVLDKSGDLFEYVPRSGKWQVLRANAPLTGSPDPEYIDIASQGSRVCALDPERNEIWRLPVYRGQRSSYFAEVLPWRIKPGDPNVSDGISIAFDGDTYVLKRTGRITRYGGGDGHAPALAKSFQWKQPPRMRPSRLFTGIAMPLFIVERENNRVIAVDKKSGKATEYLFDKGSDLRGLIPSATGFWVIDRDRLIERTLAKSDSWATPLALRRIDARLDGLTLPLNAVALPRHPGVWPGARRLYRYGIHKGVDFFCDAGRVTIGTTVRATDAGKVVRSDVNFRDMDSATYSRIMNQCRAEHKTSERNEDLFRGCQIWIDHGHGLLTRYAHLSGVKKSIKVGSFVSRGDAIGYVGVSGTGQNLPGAVKHPHLHFEIWLDGKYLGWGLTQSETLGVFEDIFGIVGQRGGS